MSAQSTQVSDLTVEELLELAKNPTGESPSGRRCQLSKDIEGLPENMLRAVTILMTDRDTANAELSLFLESHCGLDASLYRVQRHRNKTTGCPSCGNIWKADTA